MCLVVCTLRSTAKWCAVFLLNQKDVHFIDHLLLFPLFLYDVFLEHALLVSHLLLSPFFLKNLLLSQVLLSQFVGFLLHHSCVLFIDLHLLLEILELLLPHSEVLLNLFVICCHQHDISSLYFIDLWLDELLHLSPVSIVRPIFSTISKALSFG